jgi:heme/copper-type cytochrome/quinol oxidase subunit 4
MAFFVALYSYDILCCFVFLCGMLVGLIPLSICLDFKFIWASNQHGLKLVTNLHMSRKSRGQHEDLCSLVFLWHSLKLCILMTFFVVLYSYADACWFDSIVYLLWFQFIWATNQHGLKLVTNLHMSRKSRGQHEDLCSLVFLWHSLKLCILMRMLVGLIPLSICLDFNSFEHPINMVWSLWQISIWVENQEDNMKTFVALYSYDIPWSFVFSWHSL